MSASDVSEMQLTHPFPRMAETAKSAVQHYLENGCSCGAKLATLTQRLVNAAVTVHLQCAGCGRSLSGGMKRSEHYYYQTYKFWDNALREKHNLEQPFNNSDHISQREKERDRRREDYRARWLSDPAWREMRRKVLNRANQICEACLVSAATDVHHTTYQHGVLPPAFELRAVCRPCHDRLHHWRATDSLNHDLRHVSST